MQIYTFFQPDSESWIESHGKDKSEFEPWLKDWNPMFRLAFATAELRFARNMYMLPVGFSWEHRRGITLIGDAAHVFTPFVRLHPPLV